MLHVGAWARFYFDSRLNPLPSRGDRKGPALEHYACYRDGERIPEVWIDNWVAPNIQLALGVPWRLLVVDVDGQKALQQWCRWHLLGRQWPETWTVRSRRGRHYYYRIPQGITECKSRAIWLETKDRKVVKHSEIRILADKALVVAPPSRHVEKPHPVYVFMHGRQPADLEIAMAPDWLFRVPEVKPPGPIRKILPRKPKRTASVAVPYDSIDAIPAYLKLEMAKSWGLRVASEHANSAGWVCCHAIDRDDAHPSASLHLESGVFWQAGRRAMSFPALAIALGAARDFREAMELLGIKPLEAK